MSVFISIVIFIAILTFLIVIHELGHYITAKMAKIKVEEFGIGLPPRIWGFDKGGTKWSINWIPLGGFCKMAGEEDPDVPDSLAGKKPKTRLVVLSAGSIAMILFPLWLLPLAYMIPLERVSEDPGIIVSAVIAGSPAEQAGIQANDILVSIDGEEIEYFTNASDKILEANDSNPGQPVNLLLKRGSTQYNTSIVPLANPPAGQEVLGLVSGVLVTEVINGSPAYYASLHKDDIIISIDGIIVNNTREMNTVVKDASETRPNESVILMVARNTSEGIVALAFTPVPRVDPPKGEGKLGIVLQNYIITENKGYAPWEAIPKGLSEYGSIFAGIKDSFAMLFAGDVPAKDAIAGPIGIAQLTNEVSKTGGAAALFHFAALISIILGIMNLLPLPALDGGRIVFVIIEAARKGKRISAKTEGLVHMIGFAMLMALFVLISYNDIQRIISGEGFLR